MKKFFVFIFLLIFTANICYADDLRLDKETQYQKSLMKIGYRILNANNIENRMTFYYSNKKEVKTELNRSYKNIAVYKGVLLFIDSDEELAALLSHEIAQGMETYAGFWRRTAMMLRKSKYEQKSDRTAVDLMVKAGYNPVALIVILNKITAEPCFWDDFGLRRYTVGSDRMLNIYQYIYEKYPVYLVDNDYKRNLYYQNFLLVTKKQRQQFREEYKNKNSQYVTNKRI